MSTFTDRLTELRKSVGKGRMVTSVEVNQIYAHYQHVHPEFHHPDGGGADYLGGPLREHAPSYMQHMGDEVLNKRLHAAAQDNAEHLSDQVYLRAPWEFGDLRGSGHPTVTVDGEQVYDRRPHVERLETAELRNKAHLRYLFDPHRYSKRR